MAELSVTDVEAFSGGRLLASDPEVARMLAAALAVARRYAGWHVSPVRLGETLIIDGPDSRMLPLPTRKVVELTSVTEKGTVLDVDDLTWPIGGPPGIADRPIVVRKKSGGFWSGIYQAIEVTMDHGYTELEAADWRQAVLSMVDQIGSLSGRGESDLVSKKVDDVTYTWGNAYTTAAEGVIYSVNSVLANYELPRLEFL